MTRGRGEAGRGGVGSPIPRPSSRSPLSALTLRPWKGPDRGPRAPPPRTWRASHLGPGQGRTPAPAAPFPSPGAAPAARAPVHHAHRRRRRPPPPLPRAPVPAAPRLARLRSRAPPAPPRPASPPRRPGARPAHPPLALPRSGQTSPASRAPSGAGRVGTSGRGPRRGTSLPLFPPKYRFPSRRPVRWPWAVLLRRRGRSRRPPRGPPPKGAAPRVRATVYAPVCVCATVGGALSVRTSLRLYPAPLCVPGCLCVRPWVYACLSGYDLMWFCACVCVWCVSTVPVRSAYSLDT